MCSAAECRSSDLAEAEARWAARSVAQARTARPTMTASRRTSGSRREESDPWWKNALVDHGGDEPGLRDDQERRGAADGDGEHDEAPGGVRVAQEPGVERPGTPSRSRCRLRGHCRLRSLLGPPLSSFVRFRRERAARARRDWMMTRPF